MEATTNSENPELRRYSKKILISYQFGSLIWMMMNQVFVQQTQYYYQKEILLNAGLIALAFVIYTVFNMFNDPFLGYLSDKTPKFKKWGKRFPFIMLGAIPWCFTLIFIFAAPTVGQVGQFGAFIWLLIFICLYDFLFSLMDVNRGALFPEKFRDDKDRKLAGLYGTILETIGILLGIIIPILIVDLVGGWTGWLLQGVILAIICFVCVILMIPGVREDPELIEYRTHYGEEPFEFFSGMKSALKDKNLLGFVFLYTAYATTMGILIASIPFFIDDILELPKMGEIILIAYIVAVPITAGLWYKLSFKIGIKNVVLIGATVLALMGIPFLFVPGGPSGLGLTIIILFLAGLVDGAIISMKYPLFSSVVDSATLKTEKHQEGLYQGIFTFVSRLGITIRVVVFWVVQLFSGYDPDPNVSNTSLELLGLRLQMSLVPMIIMLIGLAFFWRLYQLNQEQILANIDKLQERKL